MPHDRGRRRPRHGPTSGAPASRACRRSCCAGPATAATVVAMREKDRGRWTTYTWADYADRVTAVARGLHALGVEPGDRVADPLREPPAVALRRPRPPRRSAPSPWASTPRRRRPRSSTCSATPRRRCSSPRTRSRWTRPWPCASSSRTCERIVVIDPSGVDMADDILDEPGRARGAGRQPRRSTSRPARRAIDPQAPAIIVYTSGTTGPAEGSDAQPPQPAGSRRSLGVGVRRRPATPRCCPTSRCATSPSASSPASTPWPRAT